jgi:hypothetical protein
MRFNPSQSMVFLVATTVLQIASNQYTLIFDSAAELKKAEYVL